MAKLKDEAKAYEPKQTHNIAELNEVPVDLDVEDDKFEAEDGVDEQGKPKMKTVQQKVVVINNIKYRIPNSVLNQLKVLLEDNPDLEKFKVKKSGQGLNTDYTVIPLMKGAKEEKVE